MTTNSIAALKAIFTHQEIYPENLSDVQIEALEDIQLFLNNLDRLKTAGNCPKAGLLKQAQYLIDQAFASGLHTYAHHATKSAAPLTLSKAGKTLIIAPEAVDIPAASGKQTGYKFFQEISDYDRSAQNC
ncbi:MAG: hypothetical protein LRZ85_10340 [Alphaproteobacteria bacterium]|nr:hypothetical protein [Alphaproteobacteria bacterium]MCD8520598.1 hypothetical protein [Alphaproteobacteria bacterium]